MDLAPVSRRVRPSSERVTEIRCDRINPIATAASQPGSGAYPAARASGAAPRALPFPGFRAEG
ncbi:MAG TPA: hypothetical protein VF641_12320, partial [Methylobacterium sp.]